MYSSYTDVPVPTPGSLLLESEVLTRSPALRLDAAVRLMPPVLVLP